MMPYHSRAVANYFLEVAKISRKTLDPMQVQKLVYFGHGWHFAYTNNSLIDERFEAWDYGPVVPTLYHSFKKWGSGPIKAPADRWPQESTVMLTKGLFLIDGLFRHSKIPMTPVTPYSLPKPSFRRSGTYTVICPVQHCHRLPTIMKVLGTRLSRVILVYVGVDISNDMIREYFRKKLDDNRARTHSTTR